MEQQLATVQKFIDTLMQFAVNYGFQALGALFFLFVGLKIANWAGRKTQGFAVSKRVDAALAKFLGNVLRIVLLVFVAIITLGNFGISIAPLIALAGASAFGATMAIQGPLSNYGAGLSIILSRPFAVGDTINVKGVSGVVEDITLAATVLIGEDGEKITVPNKEIVGQVIVNSRANRIVELVLAIDQSADLARAIDAVTRALAGVAGIQGEPAPQVGAHDFLPGGVALGVRFWVPSARYFATRFAANAAILAALKGSGITLLGGVTAPIKI
jgi:small conductance mechanosensitive channel